MNPELAIDSPSSESRAAPFRHGGSTTADIVRAWLFASGIVGLGGVVVFGLAALQLIAVAVTASLAVEAIVTRWIARTKFGSVESSVLIGVLVALTLPPTVPFYVVVFAVLSAQLIGRLALAQVGYVHLNAVVLGRILAQFFFEGYFSLVGSAGVGPVLAPGHLLVGDLRDGQVVTMGTYRGWTVEASEAVARTEAWRMERPVQALRKFAEGRLPPDGKLHFGPLLRDQLPPWRDTLLGLVPGAVGESCTIALIVAGLYLIYRGYVRWQLPAVILASAALGAALFPIETTGKDGGYSWFPIFAVEEGQAVGLAYVFYHLTAGSLMLGAMLLAGDMVTSPLRVRGQVLFGAGVGVLTIFMRLYGDLEGECYWAILIMNWLVPMIDRNTKRLVLGMER